MDGGIETVGEMNDDQLLIEAAQIRATKRMRFDNNNAIDGDNEVDLVASIKNIENIYSATGNQGHLGKEFFMNIEIEMLKQVTNKSKQTSIRDHFQLLK